MGSQDHPTVVTVEDLHLEEIGTRKKVRLINSIAPMTKDYNGLFRRDLDEVRRPLLSKF